MNSPMAFVGDHLVQQQVGLAARAPAHFVFVEAVEEVQDRIPARSRSLVGGRQIEAVPQFPVHQRALVGLVLDA